MWRPAPVDARHSESCGPPPLARHYPWRRQLVQHLTDGGEVKLADYGTVTSHTYLTPDMVCVAYIRSPEAMLGSQEKGPPVDAWAVCIVFLALLTGKVPTSTHLLPAVDASEEYVLMAVAALLPIISNASWPGYSKLPRWGKYEHRLRVSTVDGTLPHFVEEHQVFPSEECPPSLTLALVGLG